jgi:hypothetical protein
MKDDNLIIGPMENPGQTVQKLMTELGTVDLVPDLTVGDIDTTWLVSVPEGRKVEDLTSLRIAAAEYFAPQRRRGTARLADLQSLIDWANRFKGENSALYANPDMERPTLECIADYHAEGPAMPFGNDTTARHCAHRGRYAFPLSKEWKRWMAISGKPLDKDEMGEFIEANAKDVMDPTPALLKLEDADSNQPWETRLIQTARHIEGRYGQLGQLLAMSRQFQVYETSNLAVTSNRDTGESSIQFLNEHNDKDGAPIKIPNLIIIGIPVFENGAAYRMPVRFRYRKSGSAVKFIMSIYSPEKAFDAAFDEALTTARDGTELPLFLGQPETNT